LTNAVLFQLVDDEQPKAEDAPPAEEAPAAEES
jgi:hypothetical protein